ncbi:nucleotide-binding alpha-beta plait domain-containing protein [Tanacetum coccineum]
MERQNDFSKPSGDDGEWVKVTRKHRVNRNEGFESNKWGRHMDPNEKIGGYRKATNFDKVMKENTISFFFTNFPDSWESGALWKMFNRYGKVADVYIAFKRTKKGTRFGFVRFKNVGDVVAFERRLKGILIGDARLFINRAKFFKDGERSFQSDQQPTKARGIRLTEDNFLKSRLECCWMGKAKNFQVLQNAWDIVRNNGLENCNVKYVGGLSLLFE